MPQRENIHYNHGSFYIKALNLLTSPTSWSIIGDDDYKNITWHINNPPTEKEVLAEQDRLNTEWIASSYARERLYDYPALGELADAIYWQEKGDTSKMQAWIDKIDKIKSQWPKNNS